MTVSIIIAIKTWQKNSEKCIAKCLELDFSEYEIIVLPDFLESGRIYDSRIKVIPTGPVSPPEKRDIGLKCSGGEIIAFLDDDAYPPRDWLKNAVGNFKDEEIAAVGGPAVTPADDGLRQKASGLIYSSWLVSANYVYRYLPKHRRYVEDYPSCNLLVRRSSLDKIGGFDTNFWPGEDTKLCLDITKTLGKKILYDPAACVYHHRRPLYARHLRQVANYALHRGYFVKRYPGNSLKIAYFIPTLFVLSLVIGAILSLGFAALRTAYFSGVTLYLLLTLIISIINGLRVNIEGNLRQKVYLIPMVFTGIIFTHIAYGVYFLKGLLAKKLIEEK